MAKTLALVMSGMTVQLFILFKNYVLFSISICRGNSGKELFSLGTIVL